MSDKINSLSKGVQTEPGCVSSKHGFTGTIEQLANALYECGERNGAIASSICKTAADLILTKGGKDE